MFSADEVGNERGYLVQMTQDTLDEPYKMSPGQKVRLVSNYDARMDHYGTFLQPPLPGSERGQMCNGEKIIRTWAFRTPDLLS
jgi:hypothetical protein